MDVNTISTLIGSLGFPIICCCGMAYYINTTMKEFTKTMRDNTVAMERLIALLGGSHENT